MVAQIQEEVETKARTPDGTPDGVHQSDAEEVTHQDGPYTHPVGASRNSPRAESRTEPVARFNRSSNSRYDGESKDLAGRSGGREGAVPAQTPFNEAARAQVLRTARELYANSARRRNDPAFQASLLRRRQRRLDPQRS